MRDVAGYLENMGVLRSHYGCCRRLIVWSHEGSSGVSGSLNSPPTKPTNQQTNNNVLVVYEPYCEALHISTYFQSTLYNRLGRIFFANWIFQLYQFLLLSSIYLLPGWHFKGKKRSQLTKITRELPLLTLSGPLPIPTKFYQKKCWW